jgi:hypothetical protein
MPICLDFEVVMSLEAREMQLSLSSKIVIGPVMGEPIVGRSLQRKRTSREKKARAIHPASEVERATLF